MRPFIKVNLGGKSLKKNHPISEGSIVKTAPKTKALYDGKLFIPCPACTAIIPEDTIRNIVETVLQEANPELLKKLKSRKQGTTKSAYANEK